jgi:hypothetical protein
MDVLFFDNGETDTYDLQKPVPSKRSILPVNSRK